MLLSVCCYTLHTFTFCYLYRASPTRQLLIETDRNRFVISAALQTANLNMALSFSGESSITFCLFITWPWAPAGRVKGGGGNLPPPAGKCSENLVSMEWQNLVTMKEIWWQHSGSPKRNRNRCNQTDTFHWLKIIRKCVCNGGTALDPSGEAYSAPRILRKPLLGG